MNKRLQALRAEHDRIRSSIETIETAVADSGIDATDEQLGELETLAGRADDLARTITTVAEREDRMRATSDILARLAPVDSDGAPSGFGSAARTAPRLPSPGEYIVDCLRAKHEHDRDAIERLDRVRTSMGHGDHYRALQDQGTADNLGIIPTPIVGDLVKLVDASRPIVTVMRPMPMPTSSKTFTRPRVTTTTESGVQAAEFDILTSRKMAITGDSVTKSTHGGAVNISEQDIDWTDPALLSIVSQDLAEQYAVDTEATAEAAIEAGITTNVTNFNIATADAEDFAKAVAAAAAAVYGTAKKLPDVLMASVDAWAFLAGLTDTTGRPIFPNLNPVNAQGDSITVTSFAGNPMGLRLAVGPAFASGTLIVARSSLCEVYEQNKGGLSVVSPSTLSTILAYRGYFATNVYAQGLQALDVVGP